MEAALIYANRFKWAVLPLHSIEDGRCTCGRADCSSPGKHPRTLRGVKDATKDIAIIRNWWHEWPNANVGIATGATSGFFALDVDGEEGEKSLRELGRAERGATRNRRVNNRWRWPAPFFRWPGRAIKNKVALAPGLDIRADGGYIVAPPSNHISGRQYMWKHLDEAPLAEAPIWLIKILSEDKTYNTNGKPKATDLVLEGVPKGARDTTLFRYACRLRAQGLKREEAEILILQAAAKCKPPFPPNEALNKVASAWRYSKTYHPTDLGNAERLVALHGQDLRYCHPWGKWLVWDGKLWQEDNSAEVMRRAKETVRLMYAEAANIEDKADREALINFAMRSEQSGRLAAMISLAASEEGIPILPKDLDRDPWLLNAANGTIDLRTGELRPHSRDDLITKLIPIEYDPMAKCPRWEQFLDEIMLGNKSLIYFLQRAAGMSLAGDTSEHVLFTLYGTGRNGKSTLLNTLLALMGDYGMQAAPDILMARRGDRHPTELADLFRKATGSKYRKRTRKKDG